MSSGIEHHGLTTTVDGRPHLVGARCSSCDTHVFPTQGACPRCGAETAEVVLPATGSVWSWTVQRIRPKPPYRGPEDFEPFAVGYIDVGPVLVESRLAGLAVDEWRIGDPVTLVVDEGGPDGDGPSFVFAGGAP